MNPQAPAAGVTGSNSNSNEQQVASPEGSNQAQSPENRAPIPPGPEMRADGGQEEQQDVPEDVPMAGAEDGEKEKSDSSRADQEASNKRSREEDECQIINRPPQFKRGHFGRNMPASSSRGMTARGRGGFRAASRGRRSNSGPVVQAPNFGIVPAESLSITPQEGGTVSWNVAGHDPSELPSNMMALKTGGAAFLHETGNDASTDFVTRMIRDFANASSSTHMVTTTQPAFNPYNSGTGKREIALADNRGPTPQELDPKAQCAHCHKQGHTVADCVGPPSQTWGDIRGCPRCNTREHHYDNCKKGVKGNEAYDQFYLITSRINKPPIRTTVDWVQLALSGKLRSSQGYPWSKNFALKQLKASKESRPWSGNYDYSLDDYSQLPVDPDTKDLEAIKKARSEGRLIAEVYTPQSVTRAELQQKHAAVPATQQPQQEGQAQAQGAVNAPAPVFYQAHDQFRQALAGLRNDQQAFPVPAPASSQLPPLHGSMFNPQNLGANPPSVGLSPEQLVQEAMAVRDIAEAQKLDQFRNEQIKKEQAMLSEQHQATIDYHKKSNETLQALVSTPAYQALSPEEQKLKYSEVEGPILDRWNTVVEEHEAAKINLARHHEQELEKFRKELSEKGAKENPPAADFDVDFDI